MNKSSNFDNSLSAGRALTLTLPGNCLLQMIWCPPGEFVMGSTPDDELAGNTEKPPQAVKVSRGFWIAQCPITQTQWEAVMKTRMPLFDEDAESGLLPAEGMTWHDAQNFCDTLTSLLKTQELLSGEQRVGLPGEAQWEYACRAGTTTRWYFGDNESDLSQHAWYRDNSGRTTHPVGLKAANPWGLYDLYGNVAEWCMDDFSLYSPAPKHAEEPVLVNDPITLKIVRGGAFSHLARECRSASRESILFDNTYNEPTGLRPIMFE